MSSSSSSAHLYNQQNYGLTRSVTLPDSQHHSRRTNTYNTPNRPMHNDTEQHDGIKKILCFYFFNLLYLYRSSS
jgi:hypothetical protein